MALSLMVGQPRVPGTGKVRPEGARGRKGRREKDREHGQWRARVSRVGHC